VAGGAEASGAPHEDDQRGFADLGDAGERPGRRIRIDVVVRHSRAAACADSSASVASEQTDLCQDLGGRAIRYEGGMVAVQCQRRPRSVAGKVDKKELRRPYWAGQARDIHSRSGALPPAGGSARDVRAVTVPNGHGSAAEPGRLTPSHRRVSTAWAWA
jgi:hypothetical protein